MQQNLERFIGDPDFMMSLARGLAVLHLLAAADRPLSLAEVSRRSGLSRAASRRCLYTLCQVGYLRLDDRGYFPRTEVFTLGRGFISPKLLSAKAQEALDALRDELGESCSLGVIDEDYVRYVARAETKRIMSINLRAGSRLPLYATSMGRVLLTSCGTSELAAYLGRTDLKRLTERTVTDRGQLEKIIEEVAAAGFAIVDQELETGLRSAAVPIYGKAGVVASLNVGVAADRVSVDMLRAKFVPALQKKAAALSEK